MFTHYEGEGLHEVDSPLVHLYSVHRFGCVRILPGPVAQPGSLRLPQRLGAQGGWGSVCAANTDADPEIIIDLPRLPEDATPLILVRIPAGSFLMGRYWGASPIGMKDLNAR
jgi:hypothetical protein